MGIFFFPNGISQLLVAVVVGAAQKKARGKIAGGTKLRFRTFLFPKKRRCFTLKVRALNL